MHSTNDLLFVKLVFQENYLPSRSVLDPLPAGETKKSTRKKTCALNSVKHFHVAKTAGWLTLDNRKLAFIAFIPKVCVLSAKHTLETNLQRLRQWKEPFLFWKLQQQRIRLEHYPPVFHTGLK